LNFINKISKVEKKIELSYTKILNPFDEIINKVVQLFNQLRSKKFIL